MIRGFGHERESRRRIPCSLASLATSWQRTEIRLITVLCDEPPACDRSLLWLPGSRRKPAFRGNPLIPTMTPPPQIGIFH
jgi:hypothetical protein